MREKRAPKRALARIRAMPREARTKRRDCRDRAQMQSECISRAMVFQKFPDTASLPLSLSSCIDVPSPPAPAAAAEATSLSRSRGWYSRAFSAHGGRNPSNIRAAGFPGWSGQIAETITGSFRIPNVAGLSDVLGRSRERLNSSPATVNPVKSAGITKPYAAKFIASRERDSVAGGLSFDE